MPSRMWRKPSFDEASAAWCQRGSSRTSPGSPENSNARSAPLGGHEAQHGRTCARRGARAAGWIEKLRPIRADRDSRAATSSIAWSQMISVAAGSGGAAHVGERLFVRSERLDRTAATTRTPRRARAPAVRCAVLEDLEVVRDPEDGGIAERALAHVPKSRLPGRAQSETRCPASREAVRARPAADVRPSGFTNIWTRTAAGISWALAGRHRRAAPTPRSSAQTSVPRTGATPSSAVYTARAHDA